MARCSAGACVSRELSRRAIEVNKLLRPRRLDRRGVQNAAGRRSSARRILAERPLRARAGPFPAEKAIRGMQVYGVALRQSESCSEVNPGKLVHRAISLQDCGALLPRRTYRPNTHGSPAK